MLGNHFLLSVDLHQPLMIESSQLRLLIQLNNIPYYLYIYFNQKRNGENFHMGRHSFRKHLMKF